MLHVYNIPGHKHAGTTNDGLNFEFSSLHAALLKAQLGFYEDIVSLSPKGMKVDFDDSNNLIDHLAEIALYKCLGRIEFVVKTIAGDISDVSAEIVLPSKNGRGVAWVLSCIGPSEWSTTSEDKAIGIKDFFSSGRK
jgi:hypothetical protein